MSTFPPLRTLGSNPLKGATMKDVDAAKVAIMHIYRAITADPLGPTKVLADGKLAWINSFLNEMRGFRLVDRGNAEILWEAFTRHHAQAFPGETPSQVLDSHSEVSPITAAEARATITHDSASAPEARREFYGRDSYDMENAVQKMIDEIPDEVLVKRANGIPDESTE